MGSVISAASAKLETLLGGPMRPGESMLIAGKPGSGKTLLASQLAFEHAAAGANVLLFTLSSESQAKLLGDLERLSFFDRSLIGTKVKIFSAHAAARKGPAEVRKLIVESIKAHGAKFLLLDGVRVLRETWRSDADVREFFYDLGAVLEARRCIGVYTGEYSTKRIGDLTEAMTSDAIVALTVQARGPQRLRKIEVVKYRGRDHAPGSHSVTIDALGVIVTPRLEYRVANATAPEPSTERAAFGMPAFDALLSGGIPVSSSTVVAGSTGIGKTLIAAHFAAAGAAAGEPALIMTFDEPPSSLVARAARVGLDLASPMREGRLKITHTIPVELDVDRWAHELLENAAAIGARRIVVDGVAPLTRGILSRARADSFMVALVTALRSIGATSIFNVEIPKIAGPDLDFSDTPLQSVAENLILLRHVELGARFHRVLSILKMRASAHDFHLREFVIEPSGVRVLEPLASAEGLLTGIGRTTGRS